ncbi:MAG: hypothetical protein QOF63_252 [Thermoanaerobaculia bacterium]|jgi:hypothetical protein|nr:hypothetical protein [Thermoanaerobaculia bacterium]
MVGEELKELLNAMRDEFLGELRKETSALGQETSSLREEMRNEFALVRQESRREFAAVRQEFGAFRNETRQEFAAVRQENTVLHSETRRHFDMALEATRHEIQLVAESVLHLDKKLTARMDETDERVDQRFADTHAMIKFDREHPHRPTRRRTKPN